MRNLKQILLLLPGYPGYSGFTIPNPDKADIVSASSTVRHSKCRTAPNEGEFFASFRVRNEREIPDLGTTIKDVSLAFDMTAAFSRLLLVSLLFLIPLAGYSQNFIVNTGIGIVNSGTITTNGIWTNATGTVITNSGDITTSAGWSSAAGSSMANSGTITTSENWVHDGTMTGNGKFVLNYASDKSFKPGGSELLDLTKSGNGAALITGSLNVANQLTINAGILKLVNATDVIWAKSKSSIATSSYIDGAFAQAGGGDKVFPLGRDGRYLPITLVGLTSSKTTARIEVAPTGLSPGTAVKALVDFPYVWRVDEGAVADTATAVEVSYPNTLPIPENPIIGRQVGGTRYTSMGAKTFANTSGRVVVRSFSPRLKGIYTIVDGYLSNPEADRQALIDLYNSTKGAGWANKTNWLTETSVDQWFGVSATANTITEVNLPNNNLSGTVPQSLTGILSLQKFNAAGNAITSIPDFSGNETFNHLDVSNNKLEFGSLEPNKDLLIPPRVFNYLVQADIGEEKEELIKAGTAYNVTAPTSGTNTYVWKRGGTVVANSNSNPYQIASIGRTNMGEYTAEITNEYFPDLTLKTKPITAWAVADLKGKLLHNQFNGATNGKMVLYKVVEVGKEFEIEKEQEINSDGTFTISNVVVGDYLLSGLVDQVKYPNALPTYVGDEILWEESETLQVDLDVNGINIRSQYLPSGQPIGGKGVISGYLTDDGIDGGRVRAVKRASGVGTSIRRVQNTGRGQDEILTLVAYQFTNENGEFDFSQLEPGDYRINFQYPGFPMDTTSFINMTIGNGIKSEVRVFGEVANGKVKVNLLRITNIYEKENYLAEAFPNPASTQLNVKFGVPSQQRSVTLTDVMGREVIQESAPGLSWQTSVQGFAAGVYILKVTDKNEVVKTMRVVKE